MSPVASSASAEHAARQPRFNMTSAVLSRFLGHARDGAVWGVWLEGLAVMKIDPEPSNLSGDGTEP